MLSVLIFDPIVAGLAVFLLRDERQAKTLALVLAGLILFLGIQPHWLVQWSEQTAQSLSLTTVAVAPPISELLPK